MARLERFRWWDIPAVVDMEKEIFGVEAWSAVSFWSELAAGVRYRAAWHEGRLVGYAGLALPEGAEEAWINNIAVSAESRRLGIGRTLLDDMLAEAVAGGRKAVLLEVAVDNGPAQRLYAAYGFEGIAVRRNYYQATRTDAAVMRLDL
ncbi:ribosomal protein S18-alanine N-acetyltransferase [Salininema proteolyticum]|uniref:[Ribosomal protein bS18]-alanine N-acetyltransferase n=1 Tax=Salininema proteolyticum TaxID=1607685 RepID=A0ABV8TUF9_9ACTN